MITVTVVLTQMVLMAKVVTAALDGTNDSCNGNLTYMVLTATVTTVMTAAGDCTNDSSNDNLTYMVLTATVTAVMTAAGDVTNDNSDGCVDIHGPYGKSRDSCIGRYQ